MCNDKGCDVDGLRGVKMLVHVGGLEVVGGTLVLRQKVHVYEHVEVHKS